MTYELTAAPNGMQLKIDSLNYINIPCGSCSVTRDNSNMIIAFIDGSGKWVIPYSQVITPVSATLDALITSVSTLLACSGGGGGGGAIVGFSTEVKQDTQITNQGTLITSLSNIETILTPIDNTPTIVSVTATAVSFIISSVNLSRKGLSIWNSTGLSLYISLASTTSVSLFTAIINPNGYYELPQNYYGDISGIIVGIPTGDVLVTEF
jgi:hypothetical protein